ncbi:cupredoxin domain-containing protein [Taklimakanibacter lacteus]|uniref:cupredoxin domain-containing protein n=1 Tax=Taklimakanibacter lacteus TaxID=2268456 RepID=UPI000E668926
MRARLIATALLAVAYLTASPVLAGETAKIDIKLFQFKPKELEVKKGTTVTWTNDDAIEHSVTAGKPGKAAQDFDSGFFTKGGSFSHTFDAAGRFTYFCKRHPNMQAAVKVD